MNPTPNTPIVAIETSGRIGSVALALGPTLLAEEFFGHSLHHAAELMPTLQRLCHLQNWKSQDIAHIYVATGPGSFTGLRIAISVARAMNQATGCQLVAVPTLDVLALNAPPETTNLVALLDAKRGQVFASHYTRAEGGRGSAEDVHGSTPFVRVAGPVLADPYTFVHAAIASGGPVSVLGEGIDYHRAALAEATELDRSLWGGRASAVHKIGWEKTLRNEFTPRDQLLPTYIRLAEAEEVWRKKHGVPL